MGDYSWIPAVVGGVGKAVNSYATGDQANREVQAAYQQMLDNLQKRFGEYDALPGADYKDITAQQVGPSALEGVQADPQARAQQQQAMAALQELADRGGLSLADMKALNDIQANLSQNNTSRRKGLANEFAARGQLGSGAQLGMALDNQQNAAMNANNAGESAAAQAQARALQAMLEKGRMAREMGGDEYRRQSEAAKAKDLIEARNAAARTDASKYNNQLAGQTYEDQLAKLKGKTALSGQENDILFGRGTQQARTTAAQGGYRNDLIDQGSSAFGSLMKDDNKSPSQKAGDDAFDSVDTGDETDDQYGDYGGD